MEYIVSNEEISIIIFFLKYFFMNIGSYYIFKRLINDKKISVYNVIAVVFITISTIVYTKIQEISTPAWFNYFNVSDIGYYFFAFYSEANWLYYYNDNIFRMH